MNAPRLTMVVAFACLGCGEDVPPQPSDTARSTHPYDDVLQTLQEHEDAVLAVAFDGDGRTLLTGGVDGTVRLWDVGTGEVIGLLVASGPVRSVAITGDGTIVALAGELGNGIVELFVLGEGAVALPVTDVTAMALHPNGRQLAVAPTAEAPGVELWNLDDLTLEQTYEAEGDVGRTDHVAFSTDGLLLAARYSKGVTTNVWRVATGSLASRPTTGTEFPIAFVPNQPILAVGWGLGLVQLHDLETGTSLPDVSWASGGSTDGDMRAMSFSPDGRYFVVGREGPQASSKVRLLDATELAEPRSDRRLDDLGGHRRGVNAVAFSPDSTLLATADDDGVVLIRGAPIRTTE